MKRSEVFYEFCDDVMNQKMSVYAFTMAAKAEVMFLNKEIDQLNNRTCRNCCCLVDEKCIRDQMKLVPQKILWSGCGQWEPIGS